MLLLQVGDDEEIHRREQRHDALVDQRYSLVRNDVVVLGTEVIILDLVNHVRDGRASTDRGDDEDRYDDQLDPG